MDERVEGVKMEKTKEKKYSKGYRASDLEVLFRRGDWKNWDDAIKWLDENGEKDNELTPGEVLAIKEDLLSLKKEGVAFSSDAKSLCNKAHHCH